jgi:hypothetical protein
MRNSPAQSRLCRPFLAGLAVLAFIPLDAAIAESPAIRTQQARYHAAKKIWEEKHIPTGLVQSNGAASEQKHEHGRLAQPAALIAEEQAPAARSSGTARTVMQLSEVDFEIAKGIGFSIKKLIISLEPKKPGAPIDMDKVDSFVIRLQQGEVTLHSASLNALFNKYLLATKSHSLANVRMKTAEGRLSADADLVIANTPLGDIGIPTSFAGPLTLSQDNKLKFDIDDISSLGIPMTDVMKTLNITLPTLVSIDQPGISIKNFTITMDHRKVFPLPEMAGNIASLRLKADGLHLTFNDAPKAELSPPPFLKESYIWIQSGDPAFFGAIVTNAKIAMVPQSGGGRLHFELYNYRNQLASGEATLSEDGMMVVRLP